MANQDKGQTNRQGAGDVSLQGPQFTLQNEDAGAQGGAAGASEFAVQVHPSVHDTLGGCVSFSVVSICASVNPNPLSVEVKITILGIQVADFTLDPLHPSISINVGVAGYGLTGTIQLVDNCKVTGSLKLSTPFGDKTWSGTIVSWC